MRNKLTERDLSRIVKRVIKEDKDRKQLNKAIHKLTNLNEIRFDNKISLKKYMINKIFI